MTTARVTALLAVFFFCAAAQAANPNEYKAGTGAAVKNWGARDYEQVSKSTMPMVIYIADEGYKTNQRAKLFEELLDNKDVKEKLKPFVQIRMDTDGKRAKGWTKEYLNRGSNGAALLIVSSDMRFPVWIDKGTPKDQLKPDQLIKNMQLVSDYEVKKREFAEAQAKKDPKQKEEEVEKPKEDPGKGFAGFLGEKDKDKLPPGFSAGPKDPKAAKDDKVAKKEDMPKKKKDEPLDE